MIRIMPNIKPSLSFIISDISALASLLLRALAGPLTGRWSPQRVRLSVCSAGPSVLPGGGVHQSAGRKRQRAKARHRLPAIYLRGNTARGGMYIMTRPAGRFTARQPDSGDGDGADGTVGR